MRTLLDNPIIRREAVPRAVRRADPRARVAMAAFATLAPLAGAAYVVARQYDLADVLAYVVACAWAGLAVIVATIVCCRTIAYERTLNTWDAVVMSRLGSEGIVLGKLLAVLLPLWMLGLILAPALVLLLAFGPMKGNPFDLAYLLIPYGIALVAGGSFGSLGLYFSLICRSTPIAETATVVVIVLLMVIAFAAAARVLEPGTYYEPEEIVVGGVIFALIVLTPGFLALAHMLYRFDALDRISRR
jgi:hypothetical protein